jgi:DNA-binding XRE family transcriptional regulator
MASSPVPSPSRCAGSNDRYSTAIGIDPTLQAHGDGRYTSALGCAMRQERLRDLLTLEVLAEEAGISTTYLGQIERGLRCPSIAVVAAIAGALGMPASELLRRAERQIR